MASMSLFPDFEAEATAPGRRADLTFWHNADRGRHGWLRLTPAYSMKVVDGVLAEREQPASLVLDPFCGTGTTPLCAANRGLSGIALDINPFLIWLARTKLDSYSAGDLAKARADAERIARLLRSGGGAVGAPPDIHNIERWWHPDVITSLCAIRDAINDGGKSKASNLLSVAFCRTLIGESNAAFNHQSMSFKEIPAWQKDGKAPTHVADAFLADVSLILTSAKKNPTGRGTIVHGDARSVDAAIHGLPDLVVTSPPYPNRMSYIRELRPYMYWLGYLEEARTAGELDWSAIGGTWGIATSRLTEWEPTARAYIPPKLVGLLDDIRQSGGANAELLSTYVHKYFDDMWHHIVSLAKVIAPRAELHYIVGNVTFYGVVVPVEEVYRDMFLEAGFRESRITLLRKRNSNKHLYEYDVWARS